MPGKKDPGVHEIDVTIDTYPSFVNLFMHQKFDKNLLCFIVDKEIQQEGGHDQPNTVDNTYINQVMNYGCQSYVFSLNDEKYLMIYRN